jgi:HAMP domain-containing protein
MTDPSPLPDNDLPALAEVGAFLNRRLNAPLQRLATAARALGAGDLD